MAAPLLVIAAGGTGGHMFPAQAFAEEMLARGWRVRLATDKRGARYADGFPSAVARSVTSAASFAQGGALTRITAPFAIAAGVVANVAAMTRDRPTCVAGFGGYPSLPALVAARALRVPCLIHEQNGVLGRVNRAFAARVGAVACGVWPTEAPDAARTVHTGNPVRGAVLDYAGAAYRAPGDRPMGLVVIGGSQGAGLFSQVVPEAIGRLDGGLRDRLRLSQQVRPEDMERTRFTYDQLGVDADLRPFFTDAPRRIAEASLVISRAGAGSIADITAIGRPAVLIPYPYAANDHQAANARGLVEAGGAFMILQDRLTPETLARHISAILADPEGAAAMAKASYNQGRPDAAARLADLVEELAQRGTRA